MADLLRQTPIEYELVRVNRFELLFPTDLGLESWMVMNCSRPKYTVNPVEIPFMNTKFFVAGQYSWEAMDIEFIQTIGPSVSEKIMGWVRLQSESLSGRQGYAAGYMKDLILRSTDPTGVAIEEWVLEKCMITDADFGTNDHSDDKVQTVKITVQPQWCTKKY